ncbi:hypothetical protein BMS3Bbin06_02025 [bacterium BMS3Bbin06]|nr:hypothetical protein BMS3Bbin06_02025 [bacterium BMS3Bbin06]
MAKIEGFRIKNYRVLKDVTLGKLWNTQQAQPLTPMTVVIGKNGVGKSSLFDAFGFLADCLKLGVEEACDTRGRGGFDRIRSQGRNDPIEFQIYYKQEGNARPITYELAIDADRTGRPYVKLERLRQRRKGQKHGWPFSFLLLNEGKGVVWKGEEVGQQIDEGQSGVDLIKLMEEIEATSQKEESRETEIVELQDKRKLGIATLGALKQHPRISAFRQFIEGWYLSYFTPDSARSLPLAGPQKHLSIHGDNLGNVVQYMEREYPKRFKSILNRIAEKIPGIDRIDTEQSPDKRLLLRFNDKGFDDPFYAQQMSDGTLKVFAYLLLLEDPTPPPFICIEEPENGLYHKLLETLATEFRTHATGRKNAPQLFITTHQPYFVDALSPDETWILEKGLDGFSTIRRASDDPTVKAMVDEGLPLGSLWYSDYLDAR